MSRSYITEQLRALKPPQVYIDEELKQNLVCFGLFNPLVRVENKRQLKRERNRRRRQKNSTHLPFVTTANLCSINVACLTETWIDERNINPICPEITDKFLVFNNPRRGKQGDKR